MSDLISRIQTASIGMRTLDAEVIDVLGVERISTSFWFTEDPLEDPEKYFIGKWVRAPTRSTDSALNLAYALGCRLVTIDCSIEKRAAVLLKRPSKMPEDGPFDFKRSSAHTIALAICGALIEWKKEDT